KNAEEPSNVFTVKQITTVRDVAHREKRCQKKVPSRLKNHLMKNRSSRNNRRRVGESLKEKWVASDVLFGIGTIAQLAISNPVKSKESGWIVMDTDIGIVRGGISGKKSRVKSQSVPHGTSESEIKINATKEESQLLNEQIEESWKLEANGIKELMIDNQDSEALNAFEKSIIRDEEGRCVVSWPWKSRDVVPSKGNGLALGRLKSTIKKCRKTPELLSNYDAYFKNLVQEGVLEKMKKGENEERVAYLPQQAVINPQKTTTKLRKMFDASAKTTEGARNYNTSVSSKTSPRFRRRFNTGNRDGGIRKKRRITEIKRVKGIIFRYVKTVDNPANLASRGALTKVLKDSLLWWNGPSWMDSPTKKMDKGRSWRRS
ncbi:unnamed protein product, partial [Onchocerca ochengi]|uniref:Reverse transcriptase domain-containing protein n=1 Tax=Onchocerca ochengi TaxID=42157 RepID=A0A182E906_ONCOC